ncbi:hypothetical protein KC19_VG063900 [Ceratodon purpureus]|uniref:Uncharacterized protein n=1 Tax=Ceratodon purpureus TaxID=3225 RepID=A0A8T0HML8_CERPU|nr:hypothetical protein KC19_VG063900 [Ceratodon purpureus]
MAVKSDKYLIGRREMSGSVCFDMLGKLGEVEVVATNSVGAFMWIPLLRNSGEGNAAVADFFYFRFEHADVGELPIYAGVIEEGVISLLCVQLMHREGEPEAAAEVNGEEVRARLGVVGGRSRDSQGGLRLYKGRSYNRGGDYDMS